MSKQSFFARTFNNFVEARQREANRHVNAVLRNFSDADLKRMGITRSNLNSDRGNFPL